LRNFASLIVRFVLHSKGKPSTVIAQTQANLAMNTEIKFKKITPISNFKSLAFFFLTSAFFFLLYSCVYFTSLFSTVVTKEDEHI